MFLLYYISSFYLLVSINLSLAAVPTTGCDIVYDGYCHNIRRFSNVSLDWINSQNECESSGGDLSTIVSSTQNDLLNGLTNSAYGRCWIGLNDRDNEAGSNGSAFVWVDGSISTYRDFIDGQPDGSGGDNSDCVLLNWTMSEKRWENVNCSDALNCLFCERSIPVFGRINEGSTYESLNNDTVLISNTTLFCITETGSSMIIWSYQPIGSGITTDTRITSQASWMTNRRISEIPIYTSYPGYYSCEITRLSLTTTYTALIMEPNLLVSYIGFPTTAYTALNPSIIYISIPLFSSQVKLSTNFVSGTWSTPHNGILYTSVYNIQTFTLTTQGRYTFNTSQIANDANVQMFILEVTATGIPFAIQTSPGEYTPTSNNEIFYTNTELVCLTDHNTQVLWYYRRRNVVSRTLIASSTSSEGISVYSIVPSTKQGFYSCDAINQGFSETYRAGVFEATGTTILVAASSYSYTIGIDSQNILVLCDSNTSLNILNLDISINGAMLGNPLNLYNSRGVLYRGNGSIKCLYSGSEILNANLLIQGPPVITIKSDTDTTHTAFAPSTNSDSIRVLSQNVALQTDLIGKWKGPDGIDIRSHTITIPLFTADDAGLYQFYVTNWEGNEVLAIQISITAYGSNFAEQTGNGEYRILFDNEIIYNDTTLICATNDTSNRIEWTRKLDQNSSPVSVSSIWNVSTGVSTLSIVKATQGYYRCQVGSQHATEYDVAIFNPDNTIIVTTQMSGISYYYIKGVDSTDILLLCDLKTPFITLSFVKWRYLGRYYNNPLILNDLDAMEATSILCRVGVFVTLFNILLTIYDPSVTIVCSGSNSSTYYSLSPAMISITIPSFSLVQLSTNLESGIWVTPDSGIISSPNLTIQIFTIAFEGLYVFKTTQTWNGIEKQLFILRILTGGSSIATISGGREYIPQKNNTFFYNDASLICFTNGNTQVSWYFQPTTGLPRTRISSINNSIVTSISMQGFYSCDIVNNGVDLTYVVGIFDRSKTIVLSSNTTYNYTIGVDNTDVWVLCDTNDNIIDLKSVAISVNDNIFENPFNINESIQNMGPELKVITCFYSDVIFLNASLYFQGPPVISATYDHNIALYYSDLPSLLDINIQLFAQNVDLTMNVLGTWDSIIVGRGRSVTIDTFSLYDQEFYLIYTDYTWDGSSSYIGAVTTTAKGIPIAIKSGDVYNTSIMNNQIFFNDITLVCSSSSNSITWDFLRSSNAGFVSQAETSSTTNGLSTLDVNTNKQGFYSCIIRNNSATERYTIGVFDSRTTTIALSGDTYNYTIGVDREDILLLCDPKSDSINFDDVVWRLGDANTNLPNPLCVEDSREVLSFKDNEGLLCYNNNTNTEIPTYRVFIQGPPQITISYSDTKHLFTLTNLTSITISLLTSIDMSINLRSGEWRRGPINSSGTYPTIQIDLFTARHIGVYIYAFNFFDGREKEISVEINAIGPLIAVKSTAGYFALQNNTFGELNTELACLTSNQDTNASSINWYYQEDIPSDPQIQSGEYNDQLGATSINVVKRGIYTCRLQGDMLLSVWVLELDDNTQILSSEDFDGYDEMTYIIGDSLTLFYQNATVSLSSIRWTTDGVKNGDTDIMIEFYNNIEISDVFAQLGSGAYIFSCFYRQSPITVVGSLNLNMKDNASTNLAFNSVLQGQFSDVFNTNFPRPQTISIPILTENIKLTCDTNMCEWLIQRNGTADYSISNTEYVINVLRIENQGLYSLRRKTSADITYSTARFMLTVTGFARQSIISLNHSDTNISPITLFWELETVLPKEANQTFTVSYTENGESYKKTTTDTTFNFTDLIPGQTYTIYVTLSYTYTLGISNKSVEISVPLPRGGISLAAIIPVIILFVVASVVGLIVVLVTVIFCRRRKKSINIFKNLTEDDGKFPNISPKMLNRDATQIKTQQNRGKVHFKAGSVEYANIEEKSHYDIPLEAITKTEPNYATIDETSLVLLESEGSQNVNQLISEGKQIYYSNLGTISVQKPEVYMPLESKSRSNDEGNVIGQSHSHSRVEGIDESDEHYTPMKALEKKQFPNQPVATSIIPANLFTKTYKKYVEASSGDESVIREEFNQINLTMQSFQEKILEGRKPENKVKNPTEDALPFEANRVVLESPHLSGNYINASYIDNYNFIATMHPTAETLADFLQMLYQTEASMVVMLASRKEKAKIIGGLSNRKAYWAKEGMNLELHPFTVSTVSTSDSNVFIKQELMLTHNVEKKSKFVMQCISAVWNEDSTAVSLENILTLLIRIIKQKETTPLKPIIIHCADGISKSGVLLTIYNAVQELNQRKTINIYNAAKNLRRQRMQMVPTLACYHTCYALMNEYCSIHL